MFLYIFPYINRFWEWGCFHWGMTTIHTIHYHRSKWTCEVTARARIRISYCSALFFRSTPLYICSCSSRFSLRKDIIHHLEHTNTYLPMPNFVYPSKKRELNRTDQLALLEWSSHQQHGLFSKLFYLPAALSQVYQIPGSIPSVAVTEIVLDAFRFSSLPKSWGKVPLTLTNMGRPWVQIYFFSMICSYICKYVLCCMKIMS